MTLYSPHFSVDELQCPTAKEIVLQDGFIDDLEALRREYNRPMVCQSGCRTTEHNIWLIARGYPASPSSLHLIDNKKHGTDTCAVDIRRPGATDLHRLIRIALNRQWSIRIARDFIHLDQRTLYAGLPPHFGTY